MMTRQTIDYPETQESWDNLPQDFLDYLDVLDNAKIVKANIANTPVDPLYPTYDYEWELDERLALETILYYWNQVDKELPDSNALLDDINEGYGEAAYDDYVSSAYSY
jgi:hypothetical protein